MRVSILRVILGLLMVGVSLQGDSTVLSYVIEHEINQEDNYV